MWLTAELLRPRELISGVLTQVAAQPALTAVLSELLDSCNGGWCFPALEHIHCNSSLA